MKLDKDRINTDKSFSHPADALIEAIQQLSTRSDGKSLKEKDVLKYAIEVIKERAKQ